jgi:hypothetical protein
VPFELDAGAGSKGSDRGVAEHLNLHIIEVLRHHFTIPRVVVEISTTVMDTRTA